MQSDIPDWLNPEPWLASLADTTEARVLSALGHSSAREENFAALISPTARPFLESMAARAQQLTKRHFGNTISLYAPLYISNHCPAGCTYCGFASDRPQKRQKLNREALLTELAALKRRGIDDVLLLTGDRTKEADLDYLVESIDIAASQISSVNAEVFAMRTKEYARMVGAGCTGLTMYQETYQPEVYAKVHPWGEKRNYGFRLEAPERALEAGMRFVGIGALLGLTNPMYDAMAVFRHALRLRRQQWKAGVMISFPRICEQDGGFEATHLVDDLMLAQIIFAFRICLPDVPLVLSTREPEAFRDGMAGLGISRMSVASRTTVGGYEDDKENDPKQFQTSDRREVEAFCSSLRAKGLEPVFKNWDPALNSLHMAGHTS